MGLPRYATAQLGATSSRALFFLALSTMLTCCLPFERSSLSTSDEQLEHNARTSSLSLNDKPDLSLSQKDFILKYSSDVKKCENASNKMTGQTGGYDLASIRRALANSGSADTVVVRHEPFEPEGRRAEGVKNCLVRLGYVVSP